MRIMNRRKDGSLYIEEMTITPVRSTGGEITHFVAIKQDVTERKWTENKLQETKDQLEAILQGVADGINVLDATGQLIYVNEAAARTAGYPSAEAMLQATALTSYSKDSISSTSRVGHFQSLSFQIAWRVKGRKPRPQPCVTAASSPARKSGQSSRLRQSWTRTAKCGS